MISLDISRILSRLRSRHAKVTRKTSGKIALIVQLNTAIHDKSVKPRGNITESKLRDVQARVRDLQALFFTFESIAHRESLQVQQLTMEILKQAHELVSLTELGAALETSLTLNPELKHFLPSALGKLGRYYSVSCDLISAARSTKYKIFNRVQVKTCRVPRPVKALILHSVPSLALALQNVVQRSSSQQQERSTQALTTYLTKPLSAAEDIFRSRFSGKGNFWKVHAEIQLLFFYEFHPENIRPRVICSSKSACYLCDLFVKLHGQFHMPRTHGKLYDRWILPDWKTGISTERVHDLGIIIEKFNTLLEDKIRSTLISRRMPRNPPNESVLVLPAHWSSSNLSQASRSSSTASASVTTVRFPQSGSESSKEDRFVTSYCPVFEKAMSEGGEITTIQSPSHTYLQCMTSTATTTPAVIDPPSPKPSIEANHPFEDNRIPKTPSNALSTALPSPDNHPIIPSPAYERLTRGQYLWKELLDPSQLLRVSTNTINATLSHDYAIGKGTDEALSSSARCWVRVKWLDCDEQTQILNNASDAISVKDIAEGTEMTVKNGAAETSADLCIYRGPDMVSIKYSLMGPQEHD